MRRPLLVGISLYALCAMADARETMLGLGNSPALEGSPVMRAMMERFGVAGGLLVEKALVGALAAALAAFLRVEMKRRAPWIDLLPTTRWAREWLRSGDRSWVAFAPLYGAALAQALAAASWAMLR